MANLKASAQEFIQSVFPVQIGVLTTTRADLIATRNNITFTELMSPFCKLKTEASFRDHAGNITPIKNLQISLTHLQQSPPLPANLARKLLNYVVNSAPDQPTFSMRATNTDIDVPIATPWFEKWRDTFLKVQYPSDHEFTRHFVGCMLVVSSDDVYNSMGLVEILLKTVTDLQNFTPQKFPKFFSTNVLLYYVILHDNSEGMPVNSNELYDRLKTLSKDLRSDHYFLLQLNSRNHETTEELVNPNLWLPYVNAFQYPLSEVDYENVLSTPSEGVLSSSSSISLNQFTTQIHTYTESPTEDAIIVDPVIQSSEPELSQRTVRVEYDNVNFHPLSPSSSTLSSAPEQLPDDQSSTLTSIAHPSNSNIYGACITSPDVEQLHRLVQEFCLKALIPHMENEIQRLTDIVANRKGVSRSLFNATKRWFVSNKPGTSSTVAVQSKTYGNEDPEVQLRKLADLYFMLGNYPMAYQAYSAAKRDFYSEAAWQYYAGALEMASLSAFLMDEYTKKSCDYMEEAVNIYLTTCRMPQFATRCTLLSAECLRGVQWWGEGAKQLIRMTSEDSDLRSALLLEQSAYCFLNCKPPLGRKYAFHIVLAGHRYSKAGQRKHTFRCYQQADQIYRGRQWTLAEDHINYTLGRQASYLNLVENAAQSFSKLLTVNSQQNSLQQITFFKEMLSSYMELQQKTPGCVSKLPVPILLSELTKVALLPTAPLSAPERIPAASFVLQSNLNNMLISESFLKLEELVVQEALGGLPIVFRPQIAVFSNETNNSTKPVGVAGETITVIIKLLNPLKLAITLRDIRLVWHFVDVYNIEYSMDDAVVHTVTVPTLQLRIENTAELTLHVTPLTAGLLNILGITFGLSQTTNDEQPSTSTGAIVIQGRLDFNIPLKRLKRKSTKPGGIEDYRMNIQVVSEAPCLQVTFSHIDNELLTGEIQLVRVEMMNSGSCPLANIYFATSMPHLLYYDLEEEGESADVFTENMSVKDFCKKYFLHKVTKPTCLDSGKKFSFNLYIKAPEVKGYYLIDWIVYYQNPKQLPKYRLVKHIWEFTVSESLVPSVQTEFSENSITSGNDLNISINLTNPVYPVYVASTCINPLQAYLVAKRWGFGSKCSNETYDTGLVAKESREYYLSAYRPSNRTETKVTSLQLASNIHDAIKPLEKAFNYFIRNCVRKVVDLESVTEESLPAILKDLEEEGVLAISWHAQMTDQMGLRREGFGFIKFPLEKSPHLYEEEEILTEPLGVFRFSKSESALEEINRRQEMADLEKRQKKLKYHVSFPESVVQHDFSESLVCVVSLIINLTNLCDETLAAKIELLDQTYSHKKKLFHKWIGNTKPLDCKLMPYGSENFQLKIAFTTYGMFDLSNFFDVYCGSEFATHKSKFTLQTYRRIEVISIVPEEK